jgi:hypothetical protein
MPEPKSAFMAMIGQPAGERSRNNKYDPAHCHTIKLLAQAGKFPETWACKIGVSVETLRRWGHTYPEFKDALIIAKHLLGHYWTEQVASGIKDPRANSAMYALILRRLPALFGREPVDLTDYVLRPDDPGDEVGGHGMSAEAISKATDEDLRARLEVLRRRRQEERG